MARMTTLCVVLGTLLACDPSTRAGAQNPPEESARTDTTLATSADDLNAALAAIETLTNRIAILESKLAQQRKRLNALEGEGTARQSEVSDLRRRVGPLEGSVNNLSYAVQSANGVAQANKRYLDQNRVTITAASDLLDYVSVEGTDVIVKSANLHIRNGEGRTDAAPNGLGNLVIGYGEPLAICQGGGNDGQACISARTDCPNGGCVRLDDPILTGSHNLILGVRYQYSSHSCLLVGDGDGQEAADPYCAMLPAP